MEAITHIGIVAVSAEGAALCYRTICTGERALGSDAKSAISRTPVEAPDDLDDAVRFICDP